jgi:hypothetical protein
MSCQCNPVEGHKFPCPCDSFTHPLRLRIGAGLSDLPRQIAGFPEFRKAMLYAIRPGLLESTLPGVFTEDPADAHKHALDFWKARQPDDLGLMILEMWAYMCDSLAFYDKVIAQEEYLRTASRRPSLRRLVGLTGYLPLPSVGSYVWLTAIAEGKLKIKIPAGTAFRSTGFDGNPPQVFETDDVSWIHPFTSRWDVRAPQPEYTLSPTQHDLCVIPRIELNPGAPLLITDLDNDRATACRIISSIERTPGGNASRIQKLKFDLPLSLPLRYPFDRLELSTPLQSAGLWTAPAQNTLPSLEKNMVVMDGLYRQIRSGEYIVLKKGNYCRWFKVKEIHEVIRKMAGDKVIIGSVEYTTPGISMPATSLTLDKLINDSQRKHPDDQDWDDSMKASVSIFYAMKSAGKLVNLPGTTLSASDEIIFAAKAEKPIEDWEADMFFLSDKNTTSVLINGRVDLEQSKLIPAEYENWVPALQLPVQAFGNVIQASRGETVPREILGSGNGSQTDQTFKLRKKPLTYFPAPTVADDRGLKSTLRIFVDGMQWREVASFYGVGGDEPVYIVRQNDEHESIVTFGDGIRGRRLPTGIDNVIATYRFGGEKAVPPANTITQISKEVNGLTTINNPLPAFGGGDPETAEDLRAAAPKSILTLGRIVSIDDVVAVASAYPGIRSVQAEWRWQEEEQAPMIHVWFIGDASISTSLIARLRSMSDPSTIFHVEPAVGLISSLEIDIETDPMFVYDDVVKSVREMFMNPETGILIADRIGIGAPLFQSRIFSAAMTVRGVSSVKNILIDDQPFIDFGKSPGAGKYFDFENGSFLCQ